MAECTFGARGPGDRLWTFISSFRVSRASFLRRMPESAWASSGRRACHVLGGGECYTVFSVRATPRRQKTLVGLEVTLIPALRQAARVCPRWASRPARLELRVSEVPGKPLLPSRLVRRPFEQTNASREGRTALWHSGAEEGGGK